MYGIRNKTTNKILTTRWAPFEDDEVPEDCERVECEGIAATDTLIGDVLTKAKIEEPKESDKTKALRGIEALKETGNMKVVLEFLQERFLG